MMRILIVDDDQDSRAMVRLTLERAGYLVNEAENGRRGLEELERVHPDLVLLDLQMPVMSGGAFVDELQRRGEGWPFGVIAMSGQFDAHVSPTKWFLPKPIAASLLLAVVGDFRAARAVSALDDVPGKGRIFTSDLPKPLPQPTPVPPTTSAGRR
jgi:CheY-like chemotaxis protein